MRIRLNVKVIYINEIFYQINPFYVYWFKRIYFCTKILVVE